VLSGGQGGQQTRVAALIAAEFGVDALLSRPHRPRRAGTPILSPEKILFPNLHHLPQW
jgi:hypothetical protein